MNWSPARLWPRSLAVRLSILLVIALALAQLGLTLLLSRERDSVVEELMHSQALNQTVTLARLLNERPAGEADELIDTFRSRRTCAAIVATPLDGTMPALEQQLAAALENMLHGIQAGQPRVALGTMAMGLPGCGAREDEHDDDEDDDRVVFTDGPPPSPADDEERVASLTMDVPLLDGRWLRVATAVNLPGEANPLTFLSFLVSAVAVALVATGVVRWQTRSLRQLADASERFGRGEKIGRLDLHGPSEVTKATDAFNTMQERLSQFMRDRMQLLAGISHDLRTPLTTLRLKAELIDDDAARDDLVRTIDELVTICEATLAFTRAEAETEDTVVLDLADVARDIVGEFALAKADVAASRFESVRAAVRPVALKRALRNLVENAVRYGERARLAVFADGADAVIAVEDDGPGIPADRMADAFKPFVRLEPSRSAETGGIGLGLAIAQGVVRAHGGSLSLVNIPNGGGLRAEIRLPAMGRA